MYKKKEHFLSNAKVYISYNFHKPHNLIKRKFISICKCRHDRFGSRVFENVHQQKQMFRK